MANQETSIRQIMPETGPKPLTTSEIQFNARQLKTNEVVANKSKPTFNQVGLFLVSYARIDTTFTSRLDSDLFWASELLKFDPQQYTIQTTKYGNLGVYETKEKTLTPEQQKPTIIIEAKDIRGIDVDCSINRGKVCSSGFVFPENLPPLPLGGGQKLSPEELEQILLNAEKKDKPQPYYSRHRGFAKVNPFFAGRAVSLIAFGFQYNTGSSMLADAVVIDCTKRQLLPRVFYNLNPEKIA